MTAVVINAETTERSEMWDRAHENGPRVLLLSPEQLIFKRLEKLTNDPVFCGRVCALAVDEVHLLDSWGNSFRKAYQQVQFVRARFESSMVTIAMTATLLPGDQTQRVCKFVGLQDYHTVQRSNRRSEIQLLFCVLSHGIDGWEFPDLRWVIDDMQRKKIIIFCTGIREGFRIYSYLWWQLSSPPSVRGEQLQMYNSLNWSDYNLNTQELMRRQDGCRIIIAIDILMAGINFPNIVIIGHPPHPNDYVQKIRRAGRDRALLPNPRGITYITAHAMKAAREQFEETKPSKRKSRTEKKRKNPHKKVASVKSSMTNPMAELVVSDCKTDSLDKLYQNPPLGEHLQCNCSGCIPEPETVKRPRRSKAHSLIKEMRAAAMNRFTALRRDIFAKEAQSALTNPSFVLPQALPDELISQIVDRPLHLSFGDLSVLVDDTEITKLYVIQLWILVVEFRETFKWQLKQKADKKAASKR